MRSSLFRAGVCLLMLTAGTARAASAQTCVTIDERHDTLGPDERTAALLLVSKQFEQAGEHIAETNCQATYALAYPPRHDDHRDAVRSARVARGHGSRPR